MEICSRLSANRLVRAALAATGLVALACDGSSPTANAPDRCGPWPPQSQSPYVLPYSAGESYLVSQGNCSPGTHFAGSRDQYAYDFAMPIGTRVVAARDGVVEEVVERFFDGNGVVEEPNYLAIRHADGTLGVYFHLTHDGADVDVGRPVRQGQPIARSGNTGRAAQPHLHFGVIGGSGKTIPVTFANTEPHPDGLLPGVAYLAR